MAKELTAAELDANSQAELDAEGANLREAAEKAGAFGPGNMQEEESAPQQSEPRAPDTAKVTSESQEEKEHADNSDTGAETEERPRDEQGRFVKKDEAAELLEKVPEKVAERPGTGDGTDSTEASGSKAESSYEKAKKEADRRDRSWKALEEEKTRERAAIAAEKQQIERERQQLQAQMERTQAQQNGEPRKDEYGNTIYHSSVYAKEAERLNDLALQGQVGPNGEDYAALSKNARQTAHYYAQQEAIEYQKQFDQNQTNLALEVMKAEPDTGNINSPLGKEMQEVFRQEAELAQKNNRQSIFKIIPDGFAMAAEVAKLRLRAASVSELEAKNKQLEAEVKRLRDATSIGGSSPIKHTGPKKLEDMGMDEMRTALRSRAEAEDSMLART